MAWTHSFENARRNPKNFNIVVDIVFTDDSTPPQRFVDNDNGNGWPLGIVPAADAIALLDEQARVRIKNVFEPGDLTLAAVQAVANGKARTLPVDPTPDQKRAAIDAAQIALRKELEKSQIARAAQDNPEVQTKYAELQAAIEA